MSDEGNPDRDTKEGKHKAKGTVVRFILQFKPF